MLPLEEAREKLLASLQPRPPIVLPLAEAGGFVLADPVYADRPIPPFDRAAMEGFAVRSSDLSAEGGVLPCLGEIQAGQAWTKPLPPGTCVAIMRGAPVPPGADAVVPVEHTSLKPQGFTGPPAGEIRFLRGPQPGETIARRGEEAKAGAELLSPGTVLKPPACGVLASVGHTAVRVYQRPRVALLSTGEEIVPPEATPRETQIRDANRAILYAALRPVGFDQLTDLGITPDEEKALRAAIAPGLEHDVFILSAGVSEGRADIVPALLSEAGVEKLFAKVAIKPGMPIWAGLSSSDGAVRALPGNPLAVWIHAYETILPVLRRLAGHPDPVPPLQRARLMAALKIRGNRLTLGPVRLHWQQGQGLAQPLRCHSSADLVGAATANGLAYLMPAEEPYPAAAKLMCAY